MYPKLTMKAHIVQQEKAQAFATSHRAELGGGRPQPRLNAMQDCPRPPVTHPPVNPAKPPIKRVFEPDAEDEPAKPARVQGGQGFQQTDAKRRRTEDEDFHDTSIRPTINGPPIRQSNIRKVSFHSLFTKTRSDLS